MRDDRRSLQSMLMAADQTLDRRRFLRFAAGGTALFAAGGLLAACGDDDESGSDDATDGGDPTAPSGSGGAEPTATTAAGAEDTAESDPSEPTPTIAEASDDCAPGGVLTYALSADPPNLDPHVRTGGASDTVKRMMYSSLAVIAIDGSLEPDLAESWEISDDGLTYTITLREGVTWHSGDPLTAADVKASLERIKTLEASTYKAELEAIDTVDALDDLTAVLNLSSPSAPLLNNLYATSASIMSAAFLESGADPDTEVVGTGPFIMESYEPGEKFVVTKNPNYFMPGLPYVDRVEFIPFPDENTRMAAVMAGDVKMSEFVPWKDFESVRSDQNLTLYDRAGGSFMCVQYNVREAPFDDPKVRYALGFAYDRQSIVDIVFYGEGTPITGGMIPPDQWGHAEDLAGTFTYDPDRAKQLLAEAGYPDGFSCTLLATSQYGMHQGSAEIAQQNLQAIGIDCQLDLVDWTTSLQRHTESDYQFRIHGLGTGGADPDALTRYFDSSSSHGQSTGYADPEVDRLLEEARAITDQSERKELYDQIQAILVEQSPYSFLTYRVDGWASSADVRGFGLPPGGDSASTLRQTKVDCD